MNRELFERWIHDETLTVLDQDEEIILASGENLELLEEFLQREDALPGKRVILVSAICVVLYYNTPGISHSPNPQYVTDATEILKRNLHHLDTFGDSYLFDYIKAVVYPIIGKPFEPEQETPRPSKNPGAT